jgi:predicted ATP-grasp superfamily ATP-dependent carboligase
VRIFVCEFVTGGGFVGEALPRGLRCEGGMMLAALVKDLADLPGISIAITRDRRLPDLGLPTEARGIAPGDDPWSIWRDETDASHAVWPIAPESDGILERLSAMVLDAGRTLLGSRPEAIGLTASKRAAAAHLTARGLPVVPTITLEAALRDGLPPSRTGWVAKPDDGAGAADTVLWRDARALLDWGADRAHRACCVVQPYLPGSAASLSLLCRDGEATLLSCNSQDVRIEADRFSYHGGIVGGQERRRPVYAPLAEAIAAAVPGLWGYAGVDIVDAAQGPVVLEINPRLTTSYAGLHAALDRNPAALVLQLLSGAMPTVGAPSRIRPQPVRTDALAEEEEGAG